MKEDLTFAQRLHCALHSIKWRKLLCNRFYELTLAPRSDNLFMFGYELNPSNACSERSHIDLSVLNLFVLHVYLGIGRLLLYHTVWYRKFRVSVSPQDVYVSWGRTLQRDSGNERSKCRILPWPWHWEYVTQYYYSPNLSERVPSSDEQTHKHVKCPKAWVQSHPYSYEWSARKYENGEIVTYTERQETVARYFVTERVWRRKCFPFLKTSRRTIDVVFEDEIGPGRGTWKGGVIQVSQAMRRNELPTEALLRMMRDRRFDL